MESPNTPVFIYIHMQPRQDFFEGRPDLTPMPDIEISCICLSGLRTWCCHCCGPGCCCGMGLIPGSGTSTSVGKAKKKKKKKIPYKPKNVSAFVISALWLAKRDCIYSNVPSQSLPAVMLPTITKRT